MVPSLPYRGKSPGNTRERALMAILRAKKGKGLDATLDYTATLFFRI
jgi:hypothetical protein